MNAENKRHLSRRIFVTGIGTDVGKSYATGWLAKIMSDEGVRVITQKFIQTGNVGRSEDIEVHRKIMGIPLQEVDTDFITAPVIMSYPASPDLAAKIDGKTIDLAAIDNATETLCSIYDTVLIEGAGGVMVPIDGDYLTIDYISDRKLPAIVVTNGKLGSISDTLLTLHALRDRSIAIEALIYNPFFDTDRIIAENNVSYIREYMRKHFPDTIFLEMPREL